MSKEAPYGVQFTNGSHVADADVLPTKGGQGIGFGPHELLESSVACCINMWIRMQADKLGFLIGTVTVTVTLLREKLEEAVFNYAIEFSGALTQDQRAILIQSASTCPVSITLSKKLSFQRIEPDKPQRNN